MQKLIVMTTGKIFLLITDVILSFIIGVFLAKNQNLKNFKNQ